ncbi:hypothetical protein MYX65_01215 [Acidobacteria bacterium AH-259-L09]|nr:hypothetical protein [Acidobacteria bacterium AH-259-L09]
MITRKALTVLILFLLLPPAIALSAEKKFVGSKKSHKYHYLSCRSAKRIKPQNRIYFEPVKEAKGKGYVARKICKPPQKGQE